MWKRVVLLVLSFMVLSTAVVRAQGASPSPSPATITTSDGVYSYQFTQDEYDQYRAAIENCDTPSLECLVHYTTRFAAMEWALDIAKGGIGKIPNANENGNGGNPPAQGADASGGGIFGSVIAMSSYMFAHPPAHTGTYVADVMNTAGFVQPAYAQGIGFSSLDPILNLWKVFRNVAYFFFIVIFVVIGFMIMLRQRISGQAAVTAQQAIPSVIISLILVTFSYAIAGFMIDLMYVLMFLIIGLFNGVSFTLFNGSSLTGDNIINFSIIQLIGFLFRANINGSAFGQNINLIQEILVSVAGTENLITSVTGFAGGVTLTLVLAVAVLIGAVRLFFELLKSYAAIILYIVASPLILMFGAIPGKDVFWPWLKGIIGNLMAFPTVLLMLIIYIEFTARGSGATTVSGGSSGGFMPPFLLGNGTAGNLIGPMLGLAIILGLPDIVKEVKKAMGAGEGGLGSMLAGFAYNGIKSGVRNAPLVTGLVGAPLGAAYNVGREAIVNRQRSPVAYGQALVSGLVGGASSGFRRGKAFSRGAEQVMENKWLDPNSWENALLNMQKRIGNGSGGNGGGSGHGSSGGSSGGSGGSGSGTGAAPP